MKLAPCMRLLTIMSIKDGFWVTLFYSMSVILFGSINIIENYIQLIFFIALALTFSFIDEKISIKRGRWEYTGNMPTLFSVGATPFLELAVTGVLSFMLVFLFF